MSSYDTAIRNNVKDPFYRDKHETERRAQEMKRNQEREEKWAAEDAIEKGEKETWKTVGKSWWEKGGKSKKLSQKKKRKTLRKKRKHCKK
jgi:hypothetical protein